MSNPTQFTETQLGLPTLHLRGSFSGDDPAQCLLLGNQRLTAFADLRGRVSLMTGERGWARLNAAEPWPLADNGFSAQLQERDPECLSENGAPAPERRLGIGHARYSWAPAPALRLHRDVVALPSTEPRQGCTALLILWSLENSSGVATSLIIKEDFGISYSPCSWKNPCFNYPQFPIHASAEQEATTTRVRFQPSPPAWQSLGNAEDFSLVDSHPPHVFLASLPGLGRIELSPQAAVNAERIPLEIGLQLNCEAGESRSCGFVLGYAFDEEQEREGIAQWRDFWDTGQEDWLQAHAAKWREQVPEFAEETQEPVRLEMQWHAGTLLQMAQYIAFFDEVRLPQGTVYDYIFGASACTRDHLQHIFPIPHFAPDLAKSLLREICKRTDALGHIIHTFEGAGSHPHGGDQKSDSEIYAFKAFAEYFRATGDAAFLNEHVEFYPPQFSRTGTVLDRLERMLRYLVDVVGVGPRGLVRLLCSDWNDNSYLYMKEHYYLSLVHGAESHLNTAMAICYLKDLADALRGLDAQALPPETRDRIASFQVALESYRQTLLEALQADWPEDMPFLRRFRALRDLSIGHDNMFIEPQSYAVGIPEFGERRGHLWQEIRQRLMEGEVLGARQLEHTFSDELE